MNPHDRNAPTNGEGARLLLARLFFYTIFGAICFLLGHWSGEVKAFKACVIEQKPVAKYPKTKAEMKKFIEAYGRQGEGWK